MNRRTFVMSTAVGTLSLSVMPQLTGATQSTPIASATDSWVVGNAFSLLSNEGEPDTLSPVVEPVMFNNSTYALVLRNHYSQAIALGDVYGMVRDGDGALMGTVETAYYAPAIIEPNGICIVGVKFDSELSNRERDEASVELEYETELDTASASVANLKIADFSIRPERIIGVVENSLGSEVSLGWVVGVLFHKDGNLATWFSVTTEKWDIPAGATSTFSKNFDLPEDMRDLPYLVASRASSF